MSTFLSNIYRNVKEFYSEINAATLTGAIDVIVVEQEDGSFKCSPFHVRFGKLGVLKAKEKIVDIEINGNEVTLKMKLDDTGAAFFVENVDEEDEEKWNAELATSPLPDKSSPVASFGGRSKLAPQKLFLIDGPDSKEIKTEDVTDSLATETDSIRKGKLNKKKRRRRSDMKHNRKGSKSSLREVLLDSEMFEMDDVNDAEDELGGSEPEMSSSVPANLDLEFYRKLELRKASKPKLEISVLPTSEVDTMLEDAEIAVYTNDNIASPDTDHSNVQPAVFVPSLEITEDQSPETVYVDTSAPTFHYYSDGEADRSGQPIRPPSPGVVSDSEVEIRSEQIGVGWKWGELPTPSHPPPSSAPVTPAQEATEVKTEQTSGQREQTESGGSKSSWFGWRKNEDSSSKKNKDQEGGVTLDEIMANPDLLPKYLNPIHPELSDPLDVSQPPAPEGAASHHYNEVPVDAGEVLSDDDAESRTGLSLPMSPQGAKYDSESEELRHAATDLPSLISRHFPDLAASMCGGLTDSSITPDQFEAHLLTYQEFLDRTSLSLTNKDGGILSDPNLVIRVHEKYLSWDKAAPILLSLLLYKQPLPSDVVGNIIKDGLDVNINISPEDIEKKKQEDHARKTSSWFGWWGAGKNNGETPIKPEDIKKELDDVAEAGVQDQLDMSENALVADDSANIETDPLACDRKYKKSLRLTSDQIKELNLEAGMNEVEFSVTTAFQGTCVARCHIYLWRHSDKLIISDIDGTITKSDVLGHILPVIGKDWAHSGVADLYSKIEENGYKIMYLSARAIGQSSITKDYLQSVKQGDIFLPDGPVFLNPDSLIHAFKREVIDRNPEEFKIRCLKDIQSLFSSTVNPFFAGYGNRPNDAYAYRAVGIPVSRIFTINPTGKLKHELTQNFTSSYIEQDAMVDLMFPPYGKDGFDPDFKINEFSSFGFWRDTMVELDPNVMKDFEEVKEEVDKKKKK